MKVRLSSYLDGCPDGCPHLDIDADVSAIGDAVCAFIDCSHSKVCKIRNDGFARLVIERRRVTEGEDGSSFSVDGSF